MLLIATTPFCTIIDNYYITKCLICLLILKKTFGIITEICGYGEIGRHARFRILCRKACRFKSCYPHQTVQIRTQYQSVKGSDLSFFTTIRTLMQNTSIKFRRLIFIKTELNNIGTWGRLHYDFLYRNNRTVINVMWLNGTLNNYLADIDRDPAICLIL